MVNKSYLSFFRLVIVTFYRKMIIILDIFRVSIMVLNKFNKVSTKKVITEILGTAFLQDNPNLRKRFRL